MGPEADILLSGLRDDFKLLCRTMRDTEGVLVLLLVLVDD
jgi:hypothetical protein